VSAISSYTVVRGDTLFSIARRFGMSVADLKALNGLNSDALSLGQRLRVRTSGTETPVTPRPPVVNPTPPTPPVAGDFLGVRQQFGLTVQPDAGFRRFFLNVPLSGGGLITANMRDNLTNSRHMLYPEGIMYLGQSKTELDLASIQAVGLSTQHARALQYVSTHEGNFDAINSYDKGIFSYGFIQFVGATASGSSLNRVLASMKQYAPERFRRVFQSAGIDSDGLTTHVLDDFGRRLAGDAAWFYIQRNVRLYGPFIQAGFDPALIREQLRVANDLYVQQALNTPLSLTVNGLRLAPRVREVFFSEAAITAVIAIAINQGVGGMSRIFSASLAVIAQQLRATTVAGLARIEEQMVLQHIAATTTDERTRNRVNGVLMSGLSTFK
jgi:murein DD-endopeptidase MepM/ murein hydrolase activator NlpD